MPQLHAVCTSVFCKCQHFKVCPSVYKRQIRMRHLLQFFFLIAMNFANHLLVDTQNFKPWEFFFPFLKCCFFQNFLIFTFIHVANYKSFRSSFLLFCQICEKSSILIFHSHTVLFTSFHSFDCICFIDVI